MQIIGLSHADSVDSGLDTAINYFVGWPCPSLDDASILSRSAGRWLPDGGKYFCKSDGR
jgi:hypothetical protein